MREYLPVLIVGAIIGTFALVFILAYIALQRSKEHFDDNERHMDDKVLISRLLHYAKPYWKNFVVVFFTFVYDPTEFYLEHFALVGIVGGVDEKGNILRFCNPHEFSGAFAHLSYAPRRRRKRFRVNGLHRVDNDELVAVQIRFNIF